MEGKAPLPTGGCDDSRSRWKEVSKEPWEAGLKVQTWQHHCPRRPQFPWSVKGGHLFLADYIPRVLCRPQLGTGQKEMAGWTEARPLSRGGWLEHSMEVGLAFKLHTVAQWRGESTDKMDPDQP